MYRILLAVDDVERRARSCAETVAELPGPPDDKRVSILYSFTENPTGASATRVGSVREARDVLADAGIETEIDESSGDPADTIIDVADRIDADLIALAGRKRSPAGKALFGSVTQSVILNTDRPVLVAGERVADED